MAATKMKAIAGMNTFGHDHAINILPEVSFDQTNLPAIKGWKVGEKYTLQIEVEMVSIGKDSYDKENELRARFKILKVGEKSGEKEVPNDQKKGRMGY